MGIKDNERADSLANRAAVVGDRVIDHADFLNTVKGTDRNDFWDSELNSTSVPTSRTGCWVVHLTQLVELQVIRSVGRQENSAGSGRHIINQSGQD